MASLKEQLTRRPEGELGGGPSPSGTAREAVSREIQEHAGFLGECPDFSGGMGLLCRAQWSCVSA